MIDANLQSQLREKFNPEGSMLRRQQLRMLEILLYIDKVCKENNIKYWLSSGTLLGAVRHGGFIPWDDDLDIEMLREDYNKFVKVFNGGDLYVLQTYKTDPNYYYNFAKVRDVNSHIDEFGRDELYRYRGLFVDVFCLEHMPSIVCRFYGKVFGRIDRMGHEYHNNKLQRFLTKCLQRTSLFSFDIFRPIFRLLSEELHHSYGSYFMKERYVKDIFPLTSIQFEGYNFPAPSNTDTYLKIIFGDYHQLPNINHISKHISHCIFTK